MLGRVVQLSSRRAVLQRGGVLGRAAASTWQPQALWCAQTQQQDAQQQPAAVAAAVGRWQHRQRRWLSGAKRRPAAVGAKPVSDEQEQDVEEVDAVGELGEVAGEDAEFLQDLEELEEQVGPEISTGGVEWGDKALAVVQQLLNNPESGLEDIQLFSFRAIPSSKRLDIRLDKLTDEYGSPSLDDVAAFSRQFNAAYEAALGEAGAGEIEVEVSSPGAERQVRIPGELQRFAALPMKVEYCLEEDKVETKVLTFVEHDAAAAVTRWKLADVRVNRTGGKGRGLNRKQRDAVYELPLSTVRRVNLHIDF